MKLSTEQQWRAWLTQQARRIVHCQDDAEDVVQDTLLAYWKRFGSLPWDECADDAQLQRKCAWCCQKLRALALDLCRRAHRRYETLILNDDVRGGEQLAVADIQDTLLQQVALHEFLASLPMSLQRVAKLCSDGYSYVEIAEQLNVQVDTVKRYMARIRLLGQAFFGGSDTNRVGKVYENKRD